MLESKQVVLVNETDEVLGTADKLTTHNADTPLHRGFSVFIFNTRQQLLLQRRHSTKKTWPGFWSNSFCGHPQLDESYEQAALRHGKFELGITLNKLSFVANYRYKFTYDNVTENEICPLYFTTSNQLMIPNFKEILAIKWVKWADFLCSIETTSEIYTPWCIEEAFLLQESKIFKEYLHNCTNKESA